MANIMFVAVFAIAILAPAVSVIGQSSLPAFRAPLLDANSLSVPSVLQAKMSDDPNSAGPIVNDAEIEELARGLKYDPGLIYKFVHDHIHFDPMWGEMKGPYMTWMDRSGTSFDQAALTIALLQHAAEHNTDLTISDPKFVVGEIRLTTSSQVTNWLRILYVDDDADIATEILARAGRYASVDANGTQINAVNLEHVWVKVTINGTTYEFDPSFKSHVGKYGLYPSDLRNAMEYDESTFMTHATQGATIDYTSVKDLNQANIVSDLTTYSANLIDYIKANSPEHQTKDFIGGRVIEPATESNTPPVLPYTVISRDMDFDMAHIPDMFRTTLRIQHCGIDQTFFSGDIYGRRLTLKYNGSNQPQLILDGTVKATGNATTLGQSYDLTFTVDHPYETADFDCTTTLKVKAGGFYQIVNGWGDTGTAILSKHRSLLQEYRHEGKADSSEEVLGESYALLGTTWLAQTSRMRSLTAETTNNCVVNHHMLGITGQYDAPYIDMPINHLGVTSYDASRDPKGTFYAIAGHASAYEHEVIRQLQDCNAVSTVRLMEMANSRTTYDRIFMTNSGSWNNTQQLLYGYSQGEKDQITPYLNAGLNVHLPEFGDLTEEDWTGIGFQGVRATSSLLTASYIVGGGYSGGCASDGDALLSPSKVLDNSYGAIVDGDAEGAYSTSSSDIAIGTGSWPFGLSFGREYSSHRRLKDGPLGQGWTHNLDIVAKVTSDSFQVLSEDSPRDAAIHIVTALVTRDIIGSTPEVLSKHVIASLCETWLMDKMIDNVVNIKQGSSVLQFVKRADTPSDPNEQYIAPSGAKLKLVNTGTTFRLKDSQGTFQDFDSTGHLSEWSDAYGNKVSFTYTSGKLTQVAGKLKPMPSGEAVTARTLSFTYTGSRITGVTDSAGRSISYVYDSNNLTSYTNPDGNAVTYEYSADPNYDGLMTKIYSPIAEPNRLVTVVYDSLGRVKQQIDANNCTWDYYRARYRVEVLEPNQIDPNTSEVKRFSTVTWVNPDNGTTVTKDQMGRQTTTARDNTSRLTEVHYPTGVVTVKSLETDPADSNKTILVTRHVPKSMYSDPNLITSSEYYELYNTDGRYFLIKNRGTSVLGEDTIYKYDIGKDDNSGVGKLLAIYHPDANTVDGLQRLVEKFSYNNDGQIAYVLKMKGEPNEPNEVITKTSYEYYAAADGAGLKKVIADSNGTSPLNITTEYTYDSVGRTISVKDPRGNITQSQYHPSGLLRKTIAPAPFNYETSYEYYKDGKLKYVKQHSPASASGNNFTADPHSVALWRLEDGALTTDSVGTNTLTNNGVTATTTHVEGSHAGSFVRASQNYLSRADADLAPGFPMKSGDTNKKISVCFWVRFTNVTSWPYIFSKGGPSNNKWSFHVSLNGNAKMRAVIGYNGGASAEEVAPFGTACTTNRWYHVGVTYDDSTKSCRIRIWDQTAGALLGSDATATAVHNVNVEDGGLRLGSIETPDNYCLPGYLDEVVVFDDILSAGEIDQIRQGTYGAPAAQTDVYLQAVTYNARGQQATVRGPYPEGATQDQMNINYTQYTYDALGRSWKVTDAEGKVTETRYYPDGQVWKVIDPNGDVSLTNVYNADGTLKESLNAKGDSTTQDYDGFVRPTRVTREDKDTYTERTYDEYGRVHSVTHGTIIDPDPNKTTVYTFTYQERNWLKTKDVNDRIITYKYDVLGRVIETSDNAGTTTNTYDDAGRVTQIDCNDGSGVKTVSYEYDIAGNRTKLTYPDASYITYQYDQLGRLTKIRNQSGAVLAQYTYDALSRRLGLDYANGAGVDYSYDTASRLLYIDNQTGSGQHKYLYTYDDVGNRMGMSVTDSGGTRNHVYTYDNTYQIKDVNYPTGYDYLATDTTFNYDLLGNRTTVVDGGGTTTYSSNVLNQYTKVGSVECLYDGRGNTTYDAGQYMYTYNATNQLVTATKISGSLSAACDTTLSFTTGGNANWFAQTNDANGPDNDAAQSGAIGASQSTWMQTTVVGEGTIKFLWMHSSRTGDSAVFSIDGESKANRSSSFDWEEQSYPVTGSGTHTFKWTYVKDSSGSAGDDCMRVDFVRWTPSGTGSAANPLGDAMESDLNFTTSGDGGEWAPQTTTYYNGGDAAQSGSPAASGSYSTMETTVDGAGTLTFYWKISCVQGSDYLRFYIDDVQQDEITGSTSWAQKSYTISTSGVHWLRWEYKKESGTWNPDHRGWVDLVQWTQSGTQVAALAQATDSTLTFTTGGGGNWFSQTTTSYHGGDAAQSGSIANNGQSWMQTTVSGPGIIRFYWKVSSQLGDYLEFFIDGVRQARISGTTDWQGQSYTITGSGTHTLKWRYTKNGSGTGGSDCAWVDYVQSPSPTDWLTITYGYDSAGRRIEKAYDGQTVMKYLYDGSHIIADYDGNGSLLHKYIYGPGVDQPICMIDVEHGNAAYYYHFDGLGSVVALTNSSGSVANLYEYSVYGEVSASDPNHPNRFLFTGREFDADAGLYYYRARYYNPYIGRFLQTDPAGQGMNAYAYCGNDPLGSIDPSGTYGRRPDGWVGFRKGDHGLVFWWHDEEWPETAPREKTFDDIEGWITWVSNGNWMDNDWMQNAVGWKLAGKGARDGRYKTQKWWFWRLWAAFLLSADSSTIDKIEQNGDWLGQVKLTKSGEDAFKEYSAGNHEVFWNPGLRHIYKGKKKWYNMHPLVALVHELTHLVQDYVGYYPLNYSKDQNNFNEIWAIQQENGARRILFDCDPTEQDLYPRPGYYETWDDLGTTSQGAWEAYDPGSVDMYPPLP